MGANHNYQRFSTMNASVVSNVPKILKWEQITTDIKVILIIFCCFQCSKDTKMRANHNRTCYGNRRGKVVSNVPKILKWEQITTDTGEHFIAVCCFQCSKDTKMGANHNRRPLQSLQTPLFPMFQRY